ncbi:F-box only protein 15 isoform X2 [Ambystoma mexicanum]|uniref:F-box only protein 15 isoform X2 n=1 Tax=Ambystoma mexicanum TaxID=8296 RepID=UPI0037E74339
MAMGRGWIPSQHTALLKRGGATGSETAPTRARLLGMRPGLPTCSLPTEILLKILCYLDSVSLLCMGCVNKRLYELCNDNLIWYRIYSSLAPSKKTYWKSKAVETINNLLHHNTIEEKNIGYWKKEYISKVIAAGKNGIINLLKPVNPYTGLPVNTKEAVTAAGLIWAITLLDKCGKEYVIEQVEVSFNDTSITVFWYGTAWPSLGIVKTLQLHGVTPVLRDRSWVPSKNGPRRRTLIYEYNLTNLKDSSIQIGSDKLVKVSRLNPGLLLGLWKSGSGIAFVMASLHYHQLLQRSTMGSYNTPFVFPDHKPILDDIDSQYGLHDYQLHIDMHSGGRTYMCGSFSHLYCKKDYIRNGFLKFTVISVKNNKQHAPLAGKIGLLWKTDAFDGNVQNCFMMDVTLLDETEKPFWCVSAPVNIQTYTMPDSLYDFLGEHYVLNYKDLEGKVHMELVWMKETEEYCIINLVIYVTTEKVNSWFGTSY